MRNLIAIGICCFLMQPCLVQAQYWELGAMGGVSMYFGDLNPKFSLRFPGPTSTLLLRRNFDGRICLKGTISHAYIWADDAKSPHIYDKARNLSFASHVVSGSFQLEFNFLSYRMKAQDKKHTPYLTTGLALTYFNPKAKYLGSWTPLNPLGTEGQARGAEYSLVQPAFLLGGGFKAALGRNWALNIELMAYMLFTDYLDDVHGKYADFRTVEGAHGTTAANLSDRSLEVGEVRVGRAGQQRGDSKTLDAYMTLSVGFTYRFLRLECPAY